MNERPQFTLSDFASILPFFGTNSIIGGQAVAWWAGRYLPHEPASNPELHHITSKDIDLWGDRAFVKQLALALHCKAKFPSEYEMTVISGIIPLELQKGNTSIEVLHTVPGLDVIDSEEGGIPQDAAGIPVMILDPVALLSSKLYALRHFNQKDRQDLLHVKACVAVCPPFIMEAVRNDPKLALWYCERILKLHEKNYNRRLEKEFGFSLLSAIPHDQMAGWNHSPKNEQVQKFLEFRLGRIVE